LPVKVVKKLMFMLLSLECLRFKVSGFEFA
jgi:hypothetical protein